MSGVTPGAGDFEDHCWADVVPPETLRVYQVYERDTRIRGKATLLAVDLFASAFAGGAVPVEEAMTSNPRSCGIHGWNAIAPTRRLLDVFREASLPVVFSTQDATASTNATWRNVPRVDPRDFELLPELAPIDGEPLVRKGRASVFFGTELLETLRARDTETLVLCGETTSGCVRATAVDAFSYGLHVVVVEDAVFDRSPLSHKLSLFDLHHKYADVMTLAELERKLSDRNGDPRSSAY